MSSVALPFSRQFQGGPVPPGSPPLDWHVWPLFSSFAIAGGNTALPKTGELFNYLAGSTVSGAGSAATIATSLHTNATAVRTIAAPKVQVVTGIRLVVPPLAFTTTTALLDDTVGTTEENNDQADDLVAISQTMFFQFKIGEKVYAEAPFWMCPANTGFGGIAATSIHANASVVWQTRVALHTCGLGYEFATGQNPVLWNQQSFRFTIGCDWATNMNIIDDHLLYAVLDGFEGREIQ